MRPLRILIGLLIATVALAPLATAQDTPPADPGATDPPNEIDVDITDNRDGDGDDVDESVGFMGLSGTALIVLVVLAVIVVALIVALASRDRYP